MDLKPNPASCPDCDGITRRDLLKAAGSVAIAAAAIRLVTPSAWDSWAADDPQPFIEERRELGRRIGKALRKRLPNTAGRLRQSPLT